jgi:hypothetical protein
MAIVIANGKQAYVNDAGQPLTGGRLYTYAAGTTTPKTTWADSAQTAPNTNPIILDARGEATVFWNGAYKAELRTAADAVIWTVDNVQAVNDPVSLSSFAGPSGSSLMGFIQSGTGAVARTAQAKMRETYSVLDFGAVGDGVTNDTVACQAAITASCAAGAALYWPEGTYSVTGLTTPSGTGGRFYWYGDPSTVIKARPGTTAIVSIGDDATRTGSRVIDTIKFDGDNIANISGIKGVNTLALLYLNLFNCHVAKCYAAYEFSNIQESSFTNCYAEFSTCGWLIESDLTNGGATALTFDGCSTWQCDVAYFGKTNSPTGIKAQQWQMISCTSQLSKYCTLALIGAVGGKALITGINCDNYYSEGTGFTTSPGDTITIRGVVVPRAGIHVSGGELTINGGLVGEGNTNCPSLNLANASLVTLRDCELGGGSKSQIVADANSRINFEGRTTITGSGVGVADWDGFYFNGAGGSWTGIPFIRATQNPANKYYDAGRLPDAPEAQNAVVATPSKVLDAEYGLVQRVVYAASIGTTGTNRVTFPVLNETTAVGDFVAISFLAKATAATSLTFSTIGTSALVGPQIVAFAAGQWQRVVIFGQVPSISTGGYELYVFPPGADGPTVDFARMMVSRSAVGTAPDAPNNIIKQGIYDNMRGGVTCIGQLTYDPASIAAGGFGAEQTVTIVGGVIGEAVAATFTLDSQGIVWNARVTSATQAKVIPWNATAAPIDLASGTLRIWQ